MHCINYKKIQMSKTFYLCHCIEKSAEFTETVNKVWHNCERSVGNEGAFVEHRELLEQWFLTWVRSNHRGLASQF